MTCFKTSKKYAHGLFNAFLFLAANFSAHAQEDASAKNASPWSYKLTPSVYAAKNETTATDVNLRGNLGNHTVWVGEYVRGSAYQQTRVGYEYNANFEWGQMVPSMQVASKGFLGASLNFQIGGPTYLITGLGRTNLKDYYNLTFDPNDSYVIGLGSKAIERLVFDVSHKTGRLAQDTPSLRGNGISIAYDFGNHFVKLAKEQKVNFTDQDQTRFSAGISI